MFQPNINVTIRPEVNLFELGRIQADAGTQFTSAEFISSCLAKGINTTISAPKHQEHYYIRTET
jgi:hypothetical protein